MTHWLNNVSLRELVKIKGNTIASFLAVTYGLLYLCIYFQFIYRWQILFHRTIRLAFHKQQGLSQTSGAINNIVECCYRWQQIFETELQFVVLIKVNTLCAYQILIYLLQKSIATKQRQKWQYQIDQHSICTHR